VRRGARLRRWRAPRPLSLLLPRPPSTRREATKSTRPRDGSPTRQPPWRRRRPQSTPTPRPALLPPPLSPSSAAARAAPGAPSRPACSNSRRSSCSAARRRRPAKGSKWRPSRRSPSPKRPPCACSPPGAWRRPAGTRCWRWIARRWKSGAGCRGLRGARSSAARGRGSPTPSPRCGRSWRLGTRWWTPTVARARPRGLVSLRPLSRLPLQSPRAPSARAPRSRSSPRRQR